MMGAGVMYVGAQCPGCVFIAQNWTIRYNYFNHIPSRLTSWLRVMQGRPACKLMTQ